MSFRGSLLKPFSPKLWGFFILSFPSLQHVHFPAGLCSRKDSEQTHLSNNAIPVLLLDSKGHGWKTTKTLQEEDETGNIDTSLEILEAASVLQPSPSSRLVLVLVNSAPHMVPLTLC